LIFFCFFASAILLAIRQRITAEVVGRERKLPARKTRVIENRLQLRLQQARIA